MTVRNQPVPVGGRETTEGQPEPATKPIVREEFRTETLVAGPFRAALRINAFTFLVALACIAYMARRWLVEEAIVDGDFALDMLLGRQLIQDGYLLTGQYSRLGFHHPGPFMFYFFRLFEIPLLPIGVPRIQIWIAALVIINAAYLALAAALAVRPHKHSMQRLLLGRVAFVLLMVNLLGPSLINLWPPHMRTGAFLAFLLTLPLLMQRQFQWAPLATLLACILVHSHVTMPLFTLPCLFAALLFGFMRRRASLSRPEVAYGAACVGIAAIFMVPMVLDILLNSPSNVHRTLSYIIHRPDKLPPWTWRRSLTFTTVWWHHGSAFHYLFAFVGFLIVIRSATPRAIERLTYLLYVALTITALAIAYFRGAADSHDYVNLFYRPIPFIFLALPVACALAAPARRLGRGLQLLCLLFVLVAVGSTLNISKRFGPPKHTAAVVNKLAAGVKQATQADGEARIACEAHTDWVILAGLILKLDADGYKAKTTWRQLAYMFPPAYVCTEHEWPNAAIVSSEHFKNGWVASAGDVAVVAAHHDVHLGEPIDASSSPLMFQGWNGVANERIDSIARSCSILFRLAANAQPQGRIALHLDSHRRQPFRILLNGQEVSAGQIERGGNHLDFDVDPQIFRAGSENVLTFELPEAQAAANPYYVNAITLVKLVFH